MRSLKRYLFPIKNDSDRKLSQSRFQMLSLEQLVDIKERLLSLQQELLDEVYQELTASATGAGAGAGTSAA